MTSRAKLSSVLAVALAVAVVDVARAAAPAAFVFVPFRGSGPFPVAVWLHGYRGYSAAGYLPGATRAEMQKHADLLGAAIVGFPGPIELADGTERWSENPPTDHAYVQGRLAEIAKTTSLDASRVGLFGFSEGGLVAAEIAMLYPEKYLGAIVMSPGGVAHPVVARTREPAHADQIYFFFCGEREDPAVVALTKGLAHGIGEALGSKVTLKIYPGISRHARPPDFTDKFPEWMGAILRAR